MENRELEFTLGDKFTHFHDLSHQFQKPKESPSGQVQLPQLSQLNNILNSSSSTSASSDKKNFIQPFQPIVQETDLNSLFPLPHVSNLTANLVPQQQDHFVQKMSTQQSIPNVKQKPPMVVYTPQDIQNMYQLTENIQFTVDPSQYMTTMNSTNSVSKTSDPISAIFQHTNFKPMLEQVSGVKLNIEPIKPQVEEKDGDDKKLKKKGKMKKNVVKKKRNRKHDAFNCFKKVFRRVVTLNFPNEKRGWIRNATMTQMKSFLQKHHLVQQFNEMHAKHLAELKNESTNKKKNDYPKIIPSPAQPSAPKIMYVSTPEVVFSPDIVVPPLPIVQQTGPKYSRVAIRRFKFFAVDEQMAHRLLTAGGELQSKLPGFQAFAYRITMEGNAHGHADTYSLFDSYEHALNSHAIAAQWMAKNIFQGIGKDMTELYRMINFQMIMY